MRITPERKIEINEGVEITEAAQKVFVVLQELMNKQRSWQGLSDDEIETIKTKANVGAKGLDVDKLLHLIVNLSEQELRIKNES